MLLVKITGRKLPQVVFQHGDRYDPWHRALTIAGNNMLHFRFVVLVEVALKKAKNVFQYITLLAT